MKLYELVDATGDEVWYPLGVWLWLEEAKAEVEKCKEPRDFGSPNEYEDYFCVEIRERKTGWSDEGRTVFRREWTQIYDEDADEYIWTKRDVTK